jgi:hypothetical protein
VVLLEVLKTAVAATADHQVEDTAAPWSVALVRRRSPGAAIVLVIRGHVSRTGRRSSLVV